MSHIFSEVDFTPHFFWLSFSHRWQYLVDARRPLHFLSWAWTSLNQGYRFFFQSSVSWLRLRDLSVYKDVSSLPLSW